MAANSRQPHARGRAADGSPRVLVVDDDAGMRRLLRATLEQGAFTPVLAADGETALLLVREQPPAAVLLDINLPGLDGISVCRTIKEQPETADLPVIMLTGRGDEEAEERARAAGAAAYLLKPCSPRQVQALLRTLLGT